MQSLKVPSISFAMRYSTVVAARICHQRQSFGFRRLVAFFVFRHPSQVVQNLEHNVPGGKLNRGMSVVDTAEILKGRTLSEDEYIRAAVLGWCVELVCLDLFKSMLLPLTIPCGSSKPTSLLQTI